MRAELCVYAGCAIGLLMLPGLPGRAQEAARYRMEGVVTEAGTQRPIAGATVQVLIESGRDLSEKLLSAKTDDSGKYAISVPIGHGAAWNLLPPAGYAPVKTYDVEPFATTVDQPVFRKDYQVRKGIAWPVIVRTDAAAPLPKTYVSGGQQQPGEYVSAYSVLEGTGRGVLTLFDIGGKFDLRCADEQRTLIAPEPMSVAAAKGFRTDQVKAVQPLASGAELRDAAGLTATVVGASVEVNGEQATLVIPVRVREALDRGVLVGRVVDGNDKAIGGATVRGIGGATVRAALHGGGSSATSEFIATTDATGAFRLYLPDLQTDFMVSLVVTAAGYGGLDTEPRKYDFAKSKEADIGEIKLAPAASIPIRIVGPNGEPLVGAILEPTGSYAMRAEIVRSGPDGLCTLKNLTPGVHAFAARFGSLASGGKVPVAAGDNELLVVKLAPPRPARSAEAEKRTPALAKGTAAPEWEIAVWTDGKPRRLADYRGQVVVLDFWGVWCGPCINSIPAMKQLHERFADKEVVFLGIHTAGTDMSLIQRLLKQQDWKATTGLDVGDDIVTGKTVQAFAVHGFPTVVVIDRQGKIAFNSGDVPENKEQFMKQMEQLVTELGFPWPLDEDVTKEELQARLIKLNVAMFSREIERALNSQPQRDN